MGFAMTKKIKIIPKRGDIVQWRVNRGTYVGIASKTHSWVAVSGGPNCRVVTKDLSVWARPADRGFEVFYDEQPIGNISERSELVAFRRAYIARLPA